MADVWVGMGGGQMTSAESQQDSQPKAETSQKNEPISAWWVWAHIPLAFHKWCWCHWVANNLRESAQPHSTALGCLNSMFEQESGACKAKRYDQAIL